MLVSKLVALSVEKYYMALIRLKPGRIFTKFNIIRL